MWLSTNAQKMNYPKRLWNNNKFIFLLFISIISVNSIASGKTPDTLRMYVDSNPLSILYWTNHNVDSLRTGYTRAIIVIHGASRNADDYYDRVYTPAVLANHADQTSVIVAPNFITMSDLENLNLPEEFLYWYSSGWKKGDLSRNSSSHPRPARISSFAVIDTILIRLLQNYPDLNKIVIAGHSAGGQFVNRYAAGNPLDTLIRNQYGIIPRYIVTNPSSYVYLNRERRVGTSLNEFAIPSNPPCSDFNEYKYGLENLNTYMSISGADGIRAQYAGREIVYLLGEEDNNPNHSSLDTSCPAMLQGNHRLERGLIYYNYLIHFYGDTLTTHHTLRTVPGVGHSSSGMFSSQCGMYFLFDYGICSPSGLKPDYLPLKPEIVSVYPNPFNNSTTFHIDLPSASQISLQIYSIDGRSVHTVLRNKLLSAGTYKFSWNAKNLSSGEYIYSVIADGQPVESGKLILLK